VKYKFDGMSFTGLAYDFDKSIPDLPQVVVGVDPGVNYGLTFLTEKTLYVFWGRLPHERKLVGFEATLFVEQFMTRMGNKIATPPFAVFIEGPSYNAPVGQPLLEQIRFGFASGFSLVGCSLIDYIPPMTARKLAFGSGKKTAKDIWINLNPNAADSIGIAIAGYELANQS